MSEIIQENNITKTIDIDESNEASFELEIIIILLNTVINLK